LIEVSKPFSVSKVWKIGLFIEKKLQVLKIHTVSDLANTK